MGVLFAAVLGLAFAVIGVAMLWNLRNFGTRLVSVVPEFFRVGSVDHYRRILGACWLIGGILVLVLSLVTGR